MSFGPLGVLASKAACKLVTPWCRALSSAQISAREVAAAQAELDDFFGAEHAPRDTGGPSFEHPASHASRGDRQRTSSPGDASKQTVAAAPDPHAAAHGGVGVTHDGAPHANDGLTHIGPDGSAAMVDVSQV